MLGRETLNKSGPGVRCALSADIVNQYLYEPVWNGTEEARGWNALKV